MTETSAQVRQLKKLRELDAAWLRLVGKLSEGAPSDGALLKALIFELEGMRQQFGLPSLENVLGLRKASTHWQ